MVFAFFNDSGSVYEHFAPVGAKINSDYVIEVLRKFMKSFHWKRPEMVAGEWFLHWDNAPVHTSASVRGFLAAIGIQTLLHPPYLAPADFFLFPSIKRALSGTTIWSQSVPECLETRGQAPLNGRLLQGVLEVAKAPRKVYSSRRRLC